MTTELLHDGDGGARAAGGGSERGRRDCSYAPPSHTSSVCSCCSTMWWQGLGSRMMVPQGDPVLTLAYAMRSFLVLDISTHVGGGGIVFERFSEWLIARIGNGKGRIAWSTLATRPILCPNLAQCTGLGTV